MLFRSTCLPDTQTCIELIQEIGPDHHSNLLQDIFKYKPTLIADSFGWQNITIGKSIQYSSEAPSQTTTIGYAFNGVGKGRVSGWNISGVGTGRYGSFSGYGTRVDGNKRYEGDFYLDTIQDGALFVEDVLVYEGPFTGGKPTGIGVLHLDNDRRFEGQVQNGKPVSGKLFNKSGRLMYEGPFEKGVPHGKNGVFHLEDGARYEGEVGRGYPDKGRLFLPDGKILKGYFRPYSLKGIFESLDDIYAIYHIKVRLSETETFVGDYIHGASQGFGTVYENDEIKSEGIYMYGQKVIDIDPESGDLAFTEGGWEKIKSAILKFSKRDGPHDLSRTSHPMFTRLSVGLYDDVLDLIKEKVLETPYGTIQDIYHHGHVDRITVTKRSRHTHKATAWAYHRAR